MRCDECGRDDKRLWFRKRDSKTYCALCPQFLEGTPAGEKFTYYPKDGSAPVSGLAGWRAYVLSEI